MLSGKPVGRETEKRTSPPSPARRVGEQPVAAAAAPAAAVSHGESSPPEKLVDDALDDVAVDEDPW